MRPYVCFAILLFIAAGISAQENCESLEKCSDCIKKLGCMWCSQPADKIHCKMESSISHLSQWCSSDKLMNPKTSYEIIKNVELNTAVTGEAVQIKPQRIKLTIRKGEEFTIPFQYARSSNYPVDLYYIFDLSQSMKVHVDKLAELADTLIKVMQSTTKDFRLGFGSFVDKPTMPFKFTPIGIDEKFKDSIVQYSFKNHLSLTEDYNKFVKEVKEANLSTNVDTPEGGFDALMQAIVCKEVINWRDDATRLIVLSTDATFHFAGDGKLGGVYEPNDMQCHSNGNEYLYLIEQDYPSIGQLGYIMRKNNIHLLFAIRINENEIYTRTYEDYEQLSGILPNTYVGKLLNDSSNVVNLIKDIYNQITISLHISDNAPSNVQISYSNDRCSHATSCTNIQIGETVNFNATIKVLKCPSNPAQQQISIKPEGMNEALIIDLEAICNCDCESPDSDGYIKDSPRCNTTGDDICGICNCHEGFFGNTCECSLEHSMATADESICKKDPSNEEVCSGLGICTCGKCVCEERPAPNQIYGKYCECDNFSCKRAKGQLCSGSDHGNCKCGQCECLIGWGGEDCGCSTSKASCIAPKSQGEEVCSGRGLCVCGECKCNEESNYFGKFCEESPSDPGQRCSELFECIKASVFNSTSLDANDLDDMNCTNHNFRLTDKINEGNLAENVKICREIDDAGCTVVFTYKYLKDETLDIQIQEERLCPKPLDVWAIVAIVLSILAGGLIMLIIWKVFMNIHDANEYAKFLKSTQDSKWSADENPIYKQASTTFTNPVFGLKKDY
ncbi:hypothetical protein AMK59_7947 [Oryctes borbonicus]|uniref:Integrin beta n=1 Tax=Oryctes borbonicus TaxID=1629725 RepID=A0A0T6AU97_9SCAR|nr:hypothetical protein AMK59_7947 [Oryctes borbonicus]